MAGDGSAEFLHGALELIEGVATNDKDHPTQGSQYGEGNEE